MSTSVNALFDAKTQYTNLLRSRLADVVYDIFQSMYTRAKTIKNGETLVGFQTFMKDIQNWNMKQIQEVMDIVDKRCGERFVNQCLKAIFYLNAKILSGHHNESSDIQIRIPPIKDFLYDVVLDTAKSMYRNPGHFNTELDPEQIEHNLQLVYAQIFKAIDRAVEKSFPYENFLEVYDKRDELLNHLDGGDEQPVENVENAEMGGDGLGGEEDENEEEDEERPIRYGDPPQDKPQDRPEKPVLNSDAEDEDSDND